MSLVNISEGASLALHSMVIVAKSSPLRKNVKQLAEELNASQNHLAKVYQKLSKSGLVKSVRGPAGGFELNKRAEEISFLEIYEVIEGKVKLGGCPLNKEKCPFSKCIFTKEVNKVSAQLYETMQNIKLSDF